MIYLPPPENNAKSATLAMAALSMAGASSFLAVTDTSMAIRWLGHRTGGYPKTPQLNLCQIPIQTTYRLCQKLFKAILQAKIPRALALRLQAKAKLS